MKVDARSFRQTMGCFPTGVTVVTTLNAEGAPVGVTVSSFASVSLDPPLVLFCLDKKTSNLQSYQGSGHFAVNVLRDAQREMSIRFASRMEDKWVGIDYHVWDTGAPILPGCLANLECRTVSQHEEGDHIIFVGRVERLDYSQAGQPLIYYRGAYADLGCPVP